MDNKYDIMNSLIEKVARYFKKNNTKSIGVSEANYSCIWFLNGGIINSYQ